MAKKPSKPKKAKKVEGRKASAPAAAAPAAAKLDTSVLDALLAVTKQPAPKKDETLKEVCERVLTAMAEVKDDDFNKLPQPAQDWYNQTFEFWNADAFDKIVALPGMPGYDPAANVKTETAPPAPPKAEAAAQAKTEATPPPAGGKSGESKTEESDMAKKDKGGKKAAGSNGAARKPRTDGTAYQVRQAVVAKPDIGFEDVCKKVGLKGKDASPTGHAHNMFAHAKAVMALAGEHYSLRSK